MSDLSDIKLNLAVAEQKIKDLKEENARMVKLLEKYVTLSRFSPVEKVVYGIVGIVLAFALREMLIKLI